MASRLLVALILILALVATLGAGHAVERLNAERTPGQELLYLPNGKLLRAASLGQSSLLADLLYLWAIQFYADYDRTDRYRYVEHVFGNVIAELDPHYVDSYWLGGLILTTEANDLQAGLRLLDKGFKNNPSQWILPYLAGWECHHAGRYDLAAEYFNRAASVPDAPPLVLRMRAGMFSRMGDLAQAIREWQEVLDDPRCDAVSAAIARRQLRDLTTRLDVERLTRSISAFRSENRRWPAALVELAQRGYIDRVPVDSEGNRYRYDPRTGQVTSTAGRVLGDR